MPINQMYHTWFQWLGQLWPQAHVPRWRNAAWFMTSLLDSHSVQLQRIAGKILGRPSCSVGCAAWNVSWPIPNCGCAPATTR